MKSEAMFFWAAFGAVPLIMFYTKGARMDSKERHEIQMRVKHRSDFWAKGNTFTNTLRDRLHDQLKASVDINYGTTTTASARV
jgi:hypothetical protein